MAPRTRSGKGLSRDEILAHQRALRAGPVNTTGFSALPVELLLEIASYFPSVQIPKFSRSVYDAKYLDRAKVLRGLSQMCRSLRSIFLPYVWQRIEVCASQRLMDSASTRFLRNILWKKELATELIRQLEIVTIRDPTLAQYVKIVNVFITGYSSDTVMAELARCIALFPNLHTIQILGRGGPEPDITKAFAGMQLPSVRTVVLATHAHQILAACPNVRQVLLGSDHESAYPHIFKILSRNCRHLETLRGYSGINYDRFMDGCFLNRLLEKFPKTSTFVLDTSNNYLTVAVVKQLAIFPQLMNIEISVSTKRRSDPLPEHIQQIIQVATKVLREGPDLGSVEKRVKLIYRDSIRYIKILV